MTKKEKFINMIEKEIFENDDIYIENYENDWSDISSFWEEFKKGKTKNSGEMTEKGEKILVWMQENAEKMSNLFTAKEIGEAFFTSGRSVAGSLRKLVEDEYVEKNGKNPVQYSLTELGMNYKLDN